MAHTVDDLITCGWKSPDEVKQIEADARAVVPLEFCERLFKDLTDDELGGYSGINRPFWIKAEIERLLAARPK
jgi:hypothetical protein